MSQTVSNTPNEMKVEELTYLQLISQNEKAQEEANLKIKAQEANLEVSKKIIELTQIAESCRQKLQAAKRAIPYNLDVEFKYAKELANTQTALQYAMDVKAIRFKDALV